MEKAEEKLATDCRKEREEREKVRKKRKEKLPLHQMLLFLRHLFYFMRIHGIYRLNLQRQFENML